MGISVYVCGSSLLKFCPWCCSYTLVFLTLLSKMYANVTIESVPPTVHVRSVPGYRRSCSLSVETTCPWIRASTREKRRSPISPPESPSSNKSSKIRNRYIIYCMLCSLYTTHLVCSPPCVKDECDIDSMFCGMIGNLRFSI